MPATTNKQRLLTQLFTTLKKHCDPPASEDRPVLEQFIYAVLREGATRQQADQAYRTLQEQFFDWNEIRVSSPREIEEALAPLPDADIKAQRVIAFLQEVFEKTFAFDLETLHKKGLKQAAKQLGGYQAATDYVVAWVVQQSLGGHAIPVDAPGLRVLRRLGLVENDQDNLEAVRASLEHLVPKAKGAWFNELLSTLAHEYCWEDNPNCADCPLSGECPVGQAAAEDRAAAAGAGRGSRPKPR